MFQRLFLPALMFASVLLVSACYSVTPARFQRGFIVSGTCLELIEDENGTRRQIEVPGTPMEKLFGKYLPDNPSSVLTLAYFFHQDKDGSGSGPGTADTVNRAAFLALDLPPSRGVTVAGDLRTCLLKNDMKRAEEIFDELAEEFGVQTEVERYPKNGGFQRYHEFKVNDDGETVLHGLTRNFHPNGMISSECFFRNGKPEGKAREYSELGEPLDEE